MARFPRFKGFGTPHEYTRRKRHGKRILQKDRGKEDGGHGLTQGGSCQKPESGPWDADRGSEEGVRSFPLHLQSQGELRGEHGANVERFTQAGRLHQNFVEVGFTYSPNPAVNETIEALLALGCPPIPVAPKQDARKEWCHRVVKTKDGVKYCPVNKNLDPIPRFTGKNPSYLKRDGTARICLHGEFQTRLPTEAELKEFFCHPDTGIGTLGGHAGVDWLDFDAKCYSCQEAGDADVERIISNNNLQNTWIERTGSGGWRIAVRPQQKPTFTNFATSPDGLHVGEALYQGRFTVLAPSVHPNGNFYRRTGMGVPISVESLESIGIYPTKDEQEQTERRHKREQRKAANPHYGKPTNPQDNPWDIRNFAHYFEGYHEQGNGWAAAKCPHHNGSSQTSFRVNLDTGEYKLWCGCNTKDVYKSALALAVASGYKVPHKKQNSKAQFKEYVPDSNAKFRVKRNAKDLEQFLKSFPALSEKDGQEWLKLRQFTPDETINSEYFYHEPPHEGEGLAVNSGLGTGKSFYTNEHYIGEDDGAIFLGNRNTVIEQFVQNAKERHGLNWYLIQQDLKEGGRDDLRLIQDPQSKIISCIDSILYIQPQDAVGKKCVFDEVESTLKHLNYSTTAVSYRRQLCKQRLAEIITEAHSSLLCDGNLKDITVSYMEKLSGKKFRKVKNLYKGNRGKVTYYVGSERLEENKETNKWETVEQRLNDYSLLLNTMMEDPDPFIVGADSQEQLEAWDKQLKAKGRKTFRLDGTNSNSPEAKKFIRNPAKYIYEHGIDVVLYSPSADQGLSIDMKVELEKTIVYLSGYFKRGYFFFLGVVLTDIQIQFLGRLRDGGCHLHVYCQAKHKDANSTNKGLLSDGIQEFFIEYARDCATLSLSDVDEETRSQKLVELAHKLIEKSNDIHYQYECQLLAMAYFEQNNLRNCLEYAMREAGWQVEVVTGRHVSTTELDAIKASIRAERSEKILAAAPLTASEAQKIERAGIPNEEDKPRIIRHKLLQRIPGIDSKVITEKKIVRVPVSDTEKNGQNQVGLEAESQSQQGLDPVHIPPSNSINHEGGCGQHEVSAESLPNLTPIEAESQSQQGLDPVHIPPSNSINHEGGCGQTEALVEVEQEVTRTVFDADFIKRVKFQDRGLVSRLEGQALLRNPQVAKLAQQKKWQKKLALFQDDKEVDGVKRLNLTTYKSPWLKISTLIEMGIQFFLNPESTWTQETPEAIAFWERGKDPKIAQRIGLEVGDSNVCKYVGRILGSYGVKREAEKITLPSGVRVRQYRTAPLDPICQAIYDCVEAKILASTGEEETVLSWVQIAEKAPSPEAENPSEQGLDPVHIPPSNSINHEGVCGQADQAEPTLKSLIDRLERVSSSEQFWQAVVGCPAEMIEDAILFQSPDIKYEMRAWYEAGEVSADTSERPPLTAYQPGDEVWAYFPQSQEKWLKATVQWVRDNLIRVVSGYLGMYIEQPELIAPGDWELAT